MTISKRLLYIKKDLRDRGWSCRAWFRHMWCALAMRNIIFGLNKLFEKFFSAHLLGVSS
jgi:hypothetical protein